MIWLFTLLFTIAMAIEPVIQQSSRPMSENMAKKIIKNKSILLKLSLRKCDDARMTSSRLVTNDSSIFWFAEVPADAAFDYSCPKNAPFMSQYLLLYCKKTKKLHEIKYFQPVSKFIPAKKPRHDCMSIVSI